MDNPKDRFPGRQLDKNRKSSTILLEARSIEYRVSKALASRMLVVSMKNTCGLVAVLVFALSLTFPLAALAAVDDARFAPVVLTEEDAAKAAYSHFVKTNGECMIPEYTYRVVEVAPRDGFYAVTIALVDKLHGGAPVRVVARIVVDGTSGEIARAYHVPAETGAIEHLFDSVTKPVVDADTLAGDVEAMNVREAELAQEILSELAENRGDALERLGAFLTLLRHKDRFLLEYAEPVSARVAEAVFAKAQAGELSLSRETLRLLGELRGE